MGGWVVHKFGGTSVGDLSRYQNVGRILEAAPGDRKLVVVSAMAGVTDRLHAAVASARNRDPSYGEILAELEERHLGVVAGAGLGAEGRRLADRVRQDVRDLGDVLRAAWLKRHADALTVELVAGYGELWSAQVLRAMLARGGREVAWLDAREVLLVENGEAGVVVDYPESGRRLAAFLAREPAPWLVVTGYVASTHEGVPTTLKRNGSDYSASIFGALVEANEIIIWTDVDGVLSADPRRVPEAVVLEHLSYDEAMELAYFGAKVVHPRTMSPAVAGAIPIWIKNSLRPERPGTCIGPAREKDARAKAVKGFSTVDGVALLNVEGNGMVGVPGVAERLFGALKAVGISVILISQASSEHSLCFAVPEAAGEMAKRTVERAFAEELRQGAVQGVSLRAGRSILAAVGDAMVERPGVAAAFFAALARAGVNVEAIAQGSSERNISVVIEGAASTRALRAAHAGFFLSPLTLSLGLVGPGLVGRELLAQLAAQTRYLQERFHIELRLRGVLNQRAMLLSDAGLPPAEAVEALAAPGAPAPDLEAFTRHLAAPHLPHAAIIDCSASDQVAEQYAPWLARGVHVITPNKRAGAGPLARARAIEEAARRRGAHFFTEATVGAGLPVIHTLRDLIRTGDTVERIEGILSGTLSFLFGAVGPQRAFSAVVAEAKAKGYTEPDPRDDLSGRDVARKLVILAREMGRAVELAEVEVESLVPAALEAAPTVEEFLRRLPEHDPAFERRRAEAEGAGEVLRYVGVVERQGPPRVAIRRYPASHAFARVGGGDNVIAFTTRRYSTQPMIIQGPGAGPEVTAGGVFADLLRLMAHLGAPS